MSRRGESSPPGAAYALVVTNMALARRVARRYSRGVGVDADLHQVALLGLVLAARRYDPTVGPFQPYAVATVSGEVKRHLRNAGWAVRVSRSLQERSQQVELAAEELTASLSRSPTPSEIGAHLGLHVEDVLAAARAREAQFADAMEEDDIEMAEHDWDLAASVHEAIDQLDAEDQVLLGLQFLEDLTQREVADRLGISQSQVHRRMAAARRRLQSALETLGVKP